MRPTLLDELRIRPTRTVCGMALTVLFFYAAYWKGEVAGLRAALPSAAPVTWTAVFVTHDGSLDGGLTVPLPAGATPSDPDVQALLTATLAVRDTTTLLAAVCGDDPPHPSFDVLLRAGVVSCTEQGLVVQGRSGCEGAPSLHPQTADRLATPPDATALRLAGYAVQCAGRQPLGPWQVDLTPTTTFLCNPTDGTLGAPPFAPLDPSLQAIDAAEEPVVEALQLECDRRLGAPFDVPLAGGVVHCDRPYGSVYVTTP